MEDDIFEILSEAAKSGEIVSIIYHGGSQPGSVRDLYPIEVTIREVRAREVATGATKTFLLSKMEVASLNTSTGQYDLERRKKQEFGDVSIQEAFSGYVAAFKEMGWHVHIEEDSISLHRYFKNGKPRKGSDVGVTKYDDNPSRPYYVWGPSLAAARTFGKLSSATALVLEEAKIHAPGNAT